MYNKNSIITLTKQAYDSNIRSRDAKPKLLVLSSRLHRDGAVTYLVEYPGGMRAVVDHKHVLKKGSWDFTDPQYEVNAKDNVPLRYSYFRNPECAELIRTCYPKLAEYIEEHSDYIKKKFMNSTKVDTEPEPQQPVPVPVPEPEEPSVLPTSAICNLIKEITTNIKAELADIELLLSTIPQ